MLACEDITVVYPARGAGRTALKRVSCAVAPGSITVFVGPNGAGKSTLLRVLAGVRRPEAGSVRIDGKDLGELSARRRAARVALVAQQPSVAFDFDARRVIAFGAQGAGRPPGAVDRAIERFRLGELAGTPFGALSVGQRQRVSIARAWAQLDGSPDACLLADEPVSAMDPAHAVRTLEAFRDLADAGAGVGLVLHDLAAAVRVADHAVLLDAGGRVVDAGPGEGVLTSHALSELFGTPIRLAGEPAGPVLAASGPRRAV